VTPKTKTAGSRRLGLAVFNRWFHFFFLAVCLTSHAAAKAVLMYPDMIPSVLTNILQIDESIPDGEISGCSIRLDGMVLWVSPTRDQLILQDNTGGIVAKTDLHNSPRVQAGEHVILEGSCLISHGEIVSDLLINNDGIHSATEKSRKIFLSAGLHPIRVEWFNGPTDFTLNLDWVGPEISRQKIPATALWRKKTGLAGEAARMEPGLDYWSYEGAWNQLPDFSNLSALQHGVVTNFDLQVRPRDTNVALTFSGYLCVPQTGPYEFWLRSDDGSKLCLGDSGLHFSLLGKEPWPVPRQFFSTGLISKAQKNQWSEAQGIVTRVNEIYDGVSVELTSGAGRAYLKVINGSYDSFWPLLHSRIKAAGISQNASTLDGQIVPCLLVPDFETVSIMEIAPTHWEDSPIQSIRSLIETNFSQTGASVVHVAGIVCSNPAGSLPMIRDDTGRILLQTSQPLPTIGDRIEAIGWRNDQNNELVLQGGFYQKIRENVGGGTNDLPLLAKAIQVKVLSRKEAQRGYPVKIQGVITARVGSDFVIQDSTWSVFSYWHVPGTSVLPEIGDYWEIEGKSSVDFAPDVLVQNATYLRPGILPEPIHPTQDELINGSLDTQYIEVQGIVTAIETNAVTLLTSEGKIRMQFYGLGPKLTDKTEDALVRVRGVCSPDRDTNEMILPTLSPLRLFNASVYVDEAAPPQLFEIPLKHVSDLLFFDARADALRRVRIAGQVTGQHQGEYYLMDGENGLRFDPKTPVKLSIGDLVEVVGFPDLTGPSLVLREAVVRSAGKAGLPLARHLDETNMLSGKLDARLVFLRSRLVGLSTDRFEWVLQLQTGTRNYVARLANNRGTIPDILPGSLLGLTGVYVGLGGDRTTGRDINAFELLLNSPADIQVLARPSWWNFRHTFTVIGGMMLIILVALVWITLLRRQVEERTLQLTSEIKSREQAEHQRALEAERARIAQDLHDDLGATLTEIRFLGAVKSRDSLMPEITRTQLKEISEKSRQLVSSLDEIVWAVNPANDSLPSLASYLRHVAGEFFRTTEIRYRLDVDQSLPAVALTSEIRHNLYLVVREALNNIARHSRATEAWLRIHWKDQSLHIAVEDNGCGFIASETSLLRNGLSNMRRRLEKIGGRFTCETRAGSGTVCRIHLAFK
jgi:signal transduction histidine kinase